MLPACALTSTCMHWLAGCYMHKYCIPFHYIAWPFPFHYIAWPCLAPLDILGCCGGVDPCRCVLSCRPMSSSADEWPFVMYGVSENLFLTVKAVPLPEETVLLMEHLQSSLISAAQIKTWLNRDPVPVKVLTLVTQGWLPSLEASEEISPNINRT